MLYRNGSLQSDCGAAQSSRMTPVLNVTTGERLYSIISDSYAPDAIFLLGAGTSLESSLPLSGELVEFAARSS
jgi:hypothetical protein